MGNCNSDQSNPSGFVDSIPGIHEKNQKVSYKYIIRNKNVTKDINKHSETIVDLSPSVYHDTPDMRATPKVKEEKISPRMSLQFMQANGLTPRQQMKMQKRLSVTAQKRDVQQMQLFMQEDN